MLACIYLKNYLLAIALRNAAPQARGSDILLNRKDGQARVLAIAERAQMAGVVAGMSEQEARALFPACHILYYDACAVETASLSLLSELEKFSPSIEWIGTGMALLDLGVIPSPAQALSIAAQLITRLRFLGYETSIGLAEARFVAQVAAHTAAIDTSLHIPQREYTRFLCDKPLSYLPAPTETLRRLTLLGIHTLGALAKLPVSALTDQFGALGVRLAALAQGQDIQQMHAIKCAEALTASCDLDFPLADVELLFHTLQPLLEQLFTQLRERGQLATRLRLLLLSEGIREPQPLVLTFARPHRDLTRFEKLLKQRLAEVRLSDSLCHVAVSLEGLIGEYAKQLVFESLLPKQRHWESVERVMERLRGKENPPCLMRVVWDSPQAPVPERRAHLQDHVLPKRTRGLYLPKEIQVAVNAQTIPCQVRSTTRWIPIDRVLETWQVKDDWWTARPLLRTYYRVMLRHGGIIRLFHDQMNGHWYQQLR